MKKTLPVALLVARKTLLEYVREPQVFLLLLGTPLLLIVLYYYAFGATAGGMERLLTVVVVHPVAGAGEAETADLAGTIARTLREAEWDGRAVFGVRETGDVREARTAVEEGRAAVAIIPESGAGSGVTLVGDSSGDAYAFAVSFLRPLLLGKPGPSSGETGPGAGGPDFRYTFTPGTGTMSDFDAYVPGLIVFGILFCILSTATTLVRERTAGTRSRFGLSMTDRVSLPSGVGLAQCAVAAVQVPLGLLTAGLFGFGKSGPAGFPSFLLACAAGALAAVSTLGPGFFVAAVSRNESDAVNLGTLALLPFAFLSGALFPLPSPVLFTLRGHSFFAVDLLPASTAARAMKTLLVEGGGIGSAWFDLAALALLSILYLVPGLLAFRLWGAREPSGVRKKEPV